ncbi:MAG: deferrochelatase/peroxidase EfeB [Propionibacteriaceae bacterium]|nr:deferrochelatase/peroxidase EfeB [Propionibacteriaceae bacterium]
MTGSARRGGLSRRGLIGSAGAGAAVAITGAGAMAATNRAETSEAPAWSTVAFHGEKQAGITTAAQDRLHFAAFDVLPSATREDLVELLRDWTAAAARMTAGNGAGPSGPLSGPYDSPPDDTGEAIGLDPANLTITFGFGPNLFTDAAGADRFGLAARQPQALRRLPHFPGDNLDPAASDGDLCVQACSNDPQVAVHAIRNLTRIAFGRAAIRWSQLGFGRTSSTSTAQVTPRNLFGFKDGTASLRAEDTANIEAHVWARPDPEAAWLDGGSYLVARKIAMHIETWDRGSLREQENIIGRTKAEGAPLSGGEEFTAPDFALAGRGGRPLVDASSHLALAHPDHNAGARLLRRGYNYVDGSNQLGRLSAGLFFIAFVTDPRTHYIPMQTAMAANDLLSEYLQHIGSGLWAVPPGIAEGEFVGQALFA